MKTTLRTHSRPPAAPIPPLPIVPPRTAAPVAFVVCAVLATIVPAHNSDCAESFLHAADFRARAADRATSAAPSFFSDETLAHVARTRVIPVRIEKRDADRLLRVIVDDAAVLSAPDSCLAAAGYDLAFIRVRGVAAGTATLRIHDAPKTDPGLNPPDAPADRDPAHATGSDPSTLRVRVIDDPGPALRRAAPSIVQPVDGSAVWGLFAVGADIDAGPDRARLGDIKLSVVVNDSTEIPARSISPASTGPTLRAAFDVDASALPEGPARLRVRARHALGVSESREVVVQVLRADSDLIERHEGEADFTVQRPARFSNARRSIGRDDDASAGKYFASASFEPALCVPVSVPEPGLYQLAVRARGNLAGGALPTIGLFVDGGDAMVTNGRLVSESWHRVSVGMPVFLPVGDHVLTPVFANDFYVPGKADRNLAIDTVEIARLTPRSGNPAESPIDIPSLAQADDASPAMMQMMGMSAMGGSEAMAAMRGSDAMANATGSATMARNSDVMLPVVTPLRVAFARPLDDKPLTGSVQIDGAAWTVAAESDSAVPPDVTLELNGDSFATQRSWAPMFWVSPGWFKPGDNTVRLVARSADGQLAATTPETLTWHGPPGLEPRRHVRYPILAPAWDDSVKYVLRPHKEHWPREQRSAMWSADVRTNVTLDESLEGEFEVYLLARADAVDRRPVAKLSLARGEAITPIASVEPPDWWNEVRVGRVRLEPGPKNLTLEYAIDSDANRKADGNLWVQAVSLVSAAPEDDASAPEAALLYPSPGHAVHGADVVVAEVFDDRGITRADLLIDGREAGLGVSVGMRPGRVVLPFLAAALDDGDHTLSVVVYDDAGNRGVSREITLRVTREPADPARHTLTRAARLLNRFAYGPDPDALAQLLVRGERDWLRAMLDAEVAPDGDAGAHAFATVRDPMLYAYQAQQRALTHAMLTPNPVRARLAHVLQNHFSTFVNKTEGKLKWAEHARFSAIGTGDAPASPDWHFLDVLLASATSPAMLVYLDQNVSFAGNLNENYARELLELHTVGVDAGYSQADVTALARVLTGWCAANEGDGVSGGYTEITSFRFDPALNQSDAAGGSDADHTTPERVFGCTLPAAADRESRFDRAMFALEMLAAHPATASFICRSLAESYSALPADESLVRRLETVYHATAGNLREVLLALAADEQFHLAASPRLTKPWEFALRLARTSASDQTWLLREYLDSSGCMFFSRPTPDGFPENDEAYADSNMMIQRWKLAQRMEWQLASLVPEGMRYSNAPIDAAFTRDVIDCLALRITGSTLSPRSRDAVLAALSGFSGSRQELVVAAAPLVAQLPECSLK